MGIGPSVNGHLHSGQWATDLGKCQKIRHRFMTNLRHRIQTEIEAQHTNMKAVSLKAGLGATYVRDLLKRGRGGKLDDLARIARALGKPDNWLVESRAGQAQVEEKLRMVHVRGVAQAGIWMEFDDDFSQSQFPPIPCIPGKWSDLDQFSYRVAGPSMNQRRIFDGDYVICVPYFDARMAIATGDIVVVERRRGGTTERTVKEIVVQNGSFELWPRSSDPKFQRPIVVPDKRDLTEEDGTIIEIVGLVVGLYSPLA